jgi:hypothetical protein
MPDSLFQAYLTAEQRMTVSELCSGAPQGDRVNRRRSVTATHGIRFIPDNDEWPRHPGDPYSPCPSGVNCTNRIVVVATGFTPHMGGGFPAIWWQSDDGITRPFHSGLTKFAIRLGTSGVEVLVVLNTVLVQSDASNSPPIDRLKSARASRRSPSANFRCQCGSAF